MPAALIKRLSNLLCVKSIVTLILTVVFADLAVTGRISQPRFSDCLLRCYRLLFRHAERTPQWTAGEGHRAKIILTVIPGPRPAPSSH